jgi:hypothetical protein
MISEEEGTVPLGRGVFVEGGIHHVDNRSASGDPVSIDPEEARKLVELLRSRIPSSAPIGNDSDIENGWESPEIPGLTSIDARLHPFSIARARHGAELRTTSAASRRDESSELAKTQIFPPGGVSTRADPYSR